ncbi:MAG: efflux RND transporter periplasmic adaptor subunit [Verrucomicrobiota bacterium]
MKSSNDREDKVVEELRSLQIDRSSPDLRRRGPWAFLAVAVILGVVVFLFRPWEKFEPSEPKEVVETRGEVNSKPKSLPEEKPQALSSSAWTVAGYLVARRESLVSAEITANVAEILVEEGSTVEKGDLIARLDSALAEADYRIAKTEVGAVEHAIDAIEAELVEAKKFLERTNALSGSGATSEADLNKAESRFAALSALLGKNEAELQMARQKVERAEALLEKHLIRAPFAGIVIDRAVEVGETISMMSSSGSTTNGVCTVIDPRSIEVELDVPETMIRRVEPGGAAEVILDAYPDESFVATVKSISATANREKSTIRVWLAFQDFDERFRPEMAVKANLQPAELTKSNE